MRLTASCVSALGVLLFAGIAAASPGPPDVFLTISVTKANAQIFVHTTEHWDAQEWAKVLSSATRCPGQTFRDVDEDTSNASALCASIPRTDRGRELRIDLTPVKAQAQKDGLHSVYVWVSAPEGTLDLHGAAMRKSRHRSTAMYFGTFAVADLPPSLDIRMERAPWKAFGFLASVGGLFAFALLASGISSLRAKSGAGAAPERWFVLYMCISLRSTCIWLGLWMLCSVFNCVDTLRDSWQLTSPYAGLAIVGALVAGAAAVNLACATMEAPRYRDVRGLPVSVAEVVRIEALKDFCIALIPIGFLLMDILGNRGFAGAVLPLFVALLPISLAARSIQRTMGIRPFAASHGELRDAVFTLAARGNIALKNLYVLPATKWRLVNAFASRANSVMLSEALVEALSKREVDALAAHELTHIKETHLRKIGLWIGFLLAPLIVAGGFATVFLLEDHIIDFMPFVAVVYVLGSPAIRRRYEWRADAGAAALTGDPEAVITGLVKITKLNCWPLRFSRSWSWLVTHPSTIRRVEAIAKAWNIPQERFAALINVEMSQEEPKYAIATAETSDARIFSTEYKSRAGLAMVAASLTLLVAGPYLASITASRLSTATARIAVYLFAVLLIAALDFVIANWISGSQNRCLGERIRRKLERSGRIRKHTEATLVGIAPSSTLRLYEGRYEWDIGFLWFESGRLKFEGELGRLDVAPADVSEVKLPGTPTGLPAAAKIYASMEDGRTVGIRPVGHTTVRGGRARTLRLAEQIARWREAANYADAEPPVVSVPRGADVTSQSPRAVAITGFRALLTFAGLAMVLALMLSRLSLDMFIMIPAITVLNAATRVRPLWRFKEPSPAIGEPDRALGTAAQ